MGDYSKLKVTELKEQLGKRGLPKAGLKAELVARLEEADERDHETANANKEEQSTPLPEHQEEASGITEVSASTQVPAEVATQVIETSDGGNKVSEPEAPEAPTANSESHHQVAEADRDDGTPQELTRSEIDVLKESDRTTDSGSGSSILPGNLTQPGSYTQEQLPTPAQTQALNETEISQEFTASSSTQISVGTQEVLEDLRKRKRRSQSPPPSSIASFKRVKTDLDAKSQSKDLISESLETSEDRKEDDESSATPRPFESTQSATPVPKETSPTRPLQELESRDDAVDRRPDQETTSRKRSADDTDEKVLPSKAVKSHSKASPSEARFKDLFAGPIPKTAPAQVDPIEEVSDRDIAPSVHPATTAIYIRELMRPLNPKTMKDHLIALASSPDAEPDPSTIKQFFLDNIRTHCLVSFTSTAAASRVRSALHDRTWPNERDRRPLWVDFIPEEKLPEWVDVEQGSSGPRAQKSKRWEVYYEDQDGEIIAHLQEAGLRGQRIASAKPNATAQDLQQTAAASSRQAVKAVPIARDDHGRGFKALDDLFQSTKAKPKLYFLAVPQAEVDRRRKLLDAGRGGGRDDEMRRYSFEDDIIIDKGPEFGMRGRRGRRGGARGGGSFESSYRGRGDGGGGYRGEARPRGDMYRNGVDDYRRSGY